jgi:hypothetical protein
MRFLHNSFGFGLFLLTAACGGSGAPTQPLLPQPAIGWAITEGSGIGQQPNGMILPIVPLAAPMFALPQCASASTCWISYVEYASGPIVGGNLVLDYTIAGSNPVFVNDSPGNTCQPPNPAISLLIHQRGDTGLWNWGRIFSAQRSPLALGSAALKVPLVDSAWIGVDGTIAPGQVALQMVQAQSIGFVLGGGCFAGHGVAVSSGSALLTINGLSTQ